MNKRTVSLILALCMLLLHVKAFAVLQPPYSTEPTSEIWKTYDPVLHYFYNQLTDEEKRLFSARYDAIALGDGTLWSYQVSSLSAFSRARVNYVILRDCPELMFYTEGFDIDKLQVPPDEYLAANPERIMRLNAECTNAILPVIQGKATELDIELAIDDYIKRKCSYTIKGQSAESLNTAYSALVKGKALSVGYTFGTLYALRVAGIECFSLDGNLKTFSGGDYGRIWIQVRINGNWYQCDPILNDWDDEDCLSGFYPYLNLSTAEIRVSRSEWPVRAQLEFTHPQCMSTQDNYYVRSGLILDENWQGMLLLAVRISNIAGHTSLGVRFKTPELYKESLDCCEAGRIDAFSKLQLSVKIKTADDVLFAYFAWKE